ncbi:MAG: DUF488 domain-containing protein [Planctomycetes bacterium]|nr:DUF488 domain-containing protein [Planctomycetota bacterium]
MLTRQKIALALLREAGTELNRTAFVKLMFLLRHETRVGKDPSFYDFVPYKYGPFSFSLYWEVGSLQRNGYLAPGDEQIAIPVDALAAQRTEELPQATHEAVTEILDRYGRLSRQALLRRIYAKYPWYASRSTGSNVPENKSSRSKKARPAVYTVGYEGTSVDRLFDKLLRAGIQRVLDVRANPVSRRYGFARKHLTNIAEKMGMDYRHVPALGIPSKHRADLGDDDSYRKLFDWYERDVLPTQSESVREVAQLMEERPSALLCMERDAQRCHRNRLAHFISKHEDLEIRHL